jgi:hypothetical protein
MFEDLVEEICVIKTIDEWDEFGDHNISGF